MSDESLRGDELVSAYLDGEASPAEIAEVERDDALMARVEELRSIRDATAQPVTPLSAERRDQMISAALAVADAEAAQRREARIVPIQRRRETLLAVAAGVMLLAAVVSAGLIVSRGGDESADVAAEATPSFDAEPAPEAEAAAPATLPADADMAMADDSADYEMAAEPMAEEEPMDEAALAAAEAEEALSAAVADATEAVDPEVLAELEAQLEAAEAEAALAEAEAPAEEAAEVPAASAEEGEREEEEERRRDEEAAAPVVHLGTVENLEALFDNIAARWSAALEDGTTADSGTCYAAVDEQALELDVETAQPFTATVGTEDRITLDGRFARRADGTSIIVYAAPPDCETGVHEPPS